MNSQPEGQSQENTIIRRIREGMKVYDNQKERIGKVDELHFGAASPTQSAQGTGPATTTPADSPGENSFARMIADVFNPGEIPDVLAEKLLRTGYIRIDSAGLFAADRYIMPNQIASVSDEGVYLKVARDELIKRS
jgi:hypothetical protein